MYPPESIEKQTESPLDRGKRKTQQATGVYPVAQLIGLTPAYKKQEQSTDPKGTGLHT